jgi:hypothetical protein
MTHPLAIVDLTIAEQSEMRVLVQLHGLHPIQAVHDFQTMETDNRVLQVKNIFHCETAFSNISNYYSIFIIWKQGQYGVSNWTSTVREWRILNFLVLSDSSPILTAY